MKTFPAFLLSLCFSISVAAQVHSIEDGVLIEACQVEPSEKLLQTKSFAEVILSQTATRPNAKDRRKAINNDPTIEREKKWKLLSDPSYYPPDIPNRIVEAFPGQEVNMVDCHIHPFVEALHTAYARHYPLEISPDMIWLLIAQGFAIHVSENAEDLRKDLVDFEGRKNLDVRRDDFIKGSPNNDWEGVFPDFCNQIAEEVGEELTSLVTVEFSTTGLTEKTAFQITLMDAMESYFSYSMTTACGIPQIILRGTPEDWKSIEKRAKILIQYDLDWWIPELLTVLTEFRLAAEGTINDDFWADIYKRNSVGSGNPYITGWMLNLFPYLERGGAFVKNPTIGAEPEEIKMADISTDDFPSGLSNVDFLWAYHQQAFKMEFVAGFMGFSQDPASFVLRPEISWAILDQQLKPAEKELEAKHQGGDDKYLKSRKKG